MSDLQMSLLACDSMKSIAVDNGDERCVCALFSRVEKYRPQTLDDLISHKDILSTSKYLSIE